ncbi:hypothetical protein QA601_17100 [Chitinispirillales bacterium ANBcel5]|uniref:hypothetical protein n=1 Tax=Cellulosispirillum alkaliphilum TaxID=3039283 RepID=UPI002A535369|nr:hypothetical protein [Chitinispirillales bacterium ANBcel5]
MIDKQRTISKAKARFKKIYPFVGKSTLEECFFSLQGEYYFLFRTKDKKPHTMRALGPKRKLQVPSIQWGIVVSPVKDFVTQPVSNSPVIKFMSKPVSIRPVVKVMTQPISLKPVVKVMTQPIRVRDVFGEGLTAKAKKEKKGIGEG